MRKILIGVSAISLLALLAMTTASEALAKTHRVTAAKITVHDPVIYNSIDAPLPGNNASQSFQATQTSEFGSQIAFGGSARVLANVVATMSSWACQTGSQNVSNVGTINAPTPGSCVSAPGSTFMEPITLNLFTVGTNNAVGHLIATDTQTFAIPFRPSALPDTGVCSATSSADGTGWHDPVTDKCVHGFFTNITFSFGHVTLPNNVIYGIAYNTSGNGSHPYGYATACASSPSGCGYDGLNVGYSTSPFEPSVGSNPRPGTNYLKGTYTPFYCDNGVTGTFRIDGRVDTNNCWNGGGYNTGYSYQGIEFGGPVPSGQVSPYVIPSVQFHAVDNSAPSITSPAAGHVVAGTPFSFVISTTGVPAPRILVNHLPKGLSVVSNGNGTATITGTALTTDRSKTYVVLVHAKNFRRNSVAKQRLMLTLTGGR